MHGDGIVSLVEEYAVVAHTEPEQSIEFAAERLHVAFACLRVTVQALEDVQRGSALYRADFRRNVWTKAERLHSATGRPGRR